MATTHMTANEKILSYLRNRKGVAVTPAQVAIGARLKAGTVGTQLAKLIDAGLALRVDQTFPIAGHRFVNGIVHADYRDQWRGRIVVREKPMAYAALRQCADALEAASNKMLALDFHDVDDIEPACSELRKARDSYRDLKHRKIPPRQRFDNSAARDRMARGGDG